jgi:hypothetical protein
VIVILNWVNNADITFAVALHIIHTAALLVAGPEEVQSLLGRMAWQCRELGIHRHVTARSYAPADKIERLFYTTLYKDR